LSSEVINMAGKADEKRFYELAWPHMSAVLRMAQCLTHSAADAEDLAQETMIKAFKAIHTVRHDSNVKAWLMTIVRRAHIDRLRVAKDQASLEQLELEPARDDAAPDSDPDVFWSNPDEVLNSFSDEEVIHALRELPKEIRWTLLLVDVDGMDQTDAANVLTIPVGTVKSRLHRGRAMLRVALQRSTDSERTPVLEPVPANPEACR
jgi:RNA polymerase sigma-70 factor (ECF subfamily)